MNQAKSFMLLPICLGLTAMASQIILLREFLVIFNGNELVIGVMLSNWMLLTGLGAWLGKFSQKINQELKGIISSLLLLAFLSPVTLFMADWLRNLVFIPGSMAGIVQVFYSSLILLLPFCVLSGYLFTRISTFYSAFTGQNVAAKVYSIESIGSIAGGIMVNFFLIFFLKPFHSLLVIFFLTATLAGFIAFQSKMKTALLLISLFTVLLSGSMLFLNPDQLSRRFLFPQQDLLFYKDTPYGNLVVTRTAEQLNFFGNNSLLFTTNNIVNNEESVHYALLQRKTLDNVLLIEGGISGSIHEIVKYPVQHIEYVEINPWIIQLGEQYAPEMLDKQVSIYRGDAKLFLKQTDKRFDAVLFQVPEPSTLQANRYYTLEFLALLKTRLNPGAVISISMMPTENYVGGEAGQVQACMLSTLKKVFGHMVVIPGDKNYFLASDSSLRTDIAQLTDERQIPTEYVNGYYLDDDLLQQHSSEIMKKISIHAPLNRDFEPTLYFAQIQYWLSYFGHSIQIIPVIAFLLLIPWFIRSGGINSGIFITGFTASSLEILLLFIFQVLFGYVYLMAGILITVFMAGLALGAAFGKRIIPIPTYGRLIRLQITIGVYCLLVLGCCMVFRNWQIASLLSHAVIILLIFGTAMLASLQFQMATVVKQGTVQRISGAVYSADMLGAALGALIVSAWLTPVFGIIGSLLLLSGLNVASGLLMVLKRK